MRPCRRESFPRHAMRPSLHTATSTGSRADRGRSLCTSKMRITGSTDAARVGAGNVVADGKACTGAALGPSPPHPTRASKPKPMTMSEFPVTVGPPTSSFPFVLLPDSCIEEVSLGLGRLAEQIDELLLRRREREESLSVRIADRRSRAAGL